MNEIGFGEAQRLGIQGSSEDDPSGHALAKAAYAAGAVDSALAVPLSTYDVTIRVVVAGTRMSAEYVAAVLEQHCDRLGDITEHGFTVAERPTGGTQ